MTNEPFNFWNEKKAYDLEGFVSCLGEITNEEFLSYVNSSKNDFANWIEYSLQNIELAEKIRPLLELDLIRATVSNFLSSEQNKVMIGAMAKAAQEDSLVKEVMKKNEAFFNSVNSDKKEPEKTPRKNAEEKGSKLSFIDFPLLKRNKSEAKPQLIFETKHDKKFERWMIQDFVAGIVFGIFIGALLTLILIQLL